MRLIRKILYSSLLLCSYAIGQANADSAQVEATSTKKDFQRFSLMPVLGYTEETEYQIGAMAILFFKPNFEGGKTTEMDLALYGTTRRQFTLSISPKFYAFNDHISGNMDLYYQNWVGHYFGLGNNPDIDDYRVFDRETYYLKGLVESDFGIPQNEFNFKYGIALDFNYTTISFNNYRGELEQPKNTDGWRNGLGYHFTIDGRDNTNWARHGYLVQWEQVFYSGAFGDYSFSREELDLRGYSEFIWNTSMAVGFLWKRVTGDAPFDKLAGSDGIKRFRGVESNYFCGNQAMFLQVEFRKKLFWRLAGDIFFEGGKAGDYFSDLWRNKWHRSVGFGGQLGLNMSENLYARCEFSWVDFKSLGVTMYVREAF